MKLTVDLGKNSYPIYIENNLLERAGERIPQAFSGKRIMIISDDNVYPLYGDTLERALSGAYECHHLVLPHGEATKSFQSLPGIYTAMLEAKISRSDAVIALGGGVIGDLAGFAAASFLRGVKFIQIPTSLLAQVDSSVGGKVAVDLPEGKNLVGAFYQPSLVLIDPSALDDVAADASGHGVKGGIAGDLLTLESQGAEILGFQLYDLQGRMIAMPQTAPAQTVTASVEAVGSSVVVVRVLLSDSSVAVLKLAR